MRARVCVSVSLYSHSLVIETEKPIQFPKLSSEKCKKKRKENETKKEKKNDVITMNEN